MRSSIARIALLTLGMGTLVACRPGGTLPTGDPVCVATSVDMKEVTCPAPPNLLEGDYCTCVMAGSGQRFGGRVRGGF